VIRPPRKKETAKYLDLHRTHASLSPAPGLGWRAEWLFNHTNTARGIAAALLQELEVHDSKPTYLETAKPKKIDAKKNRFLSTNSAVGHSILRTMDSITANLVRSLIPSEITWRLPKAYCE